MVRRDGPVLLVVHRAWMDALPVASMLAGAPLTSWGEPREHALRGRTTVHVLATPRGEMVAKALARGGLVGGLLRHHYLDPWRGAREALLAEDLLRAGCATPSLVVARARAVGGPFHRLETASARVEGAVDLLAASRGARADDPDRLPVLAGATGAALGRLHRAGLRHRDLQVKNLLVPPEGPLQVIDLDRCRLGAPLGPGERVDALVRFARSLAKRGLLPRERVALDPWGRRALLAFWRAYLTSESSGMRKELPFRVRRGLGRALRARAWRWAPADGSSSESQKSGP